jgi:large conductance mechanosensitive channel
VDDVIMPPIGLLLGHVDFSNMFAVLKEGKTPGPYLSVAAAKAAGATTLNFGVFVNTIINFVIVGFAIFMMVKGVNRLRRPKSVPAGEPTTKDCPFCYSSIPIKATRCPNCTSELKAA